VVKHLRGTHVIVYGGGNRNNTEGEQTTKKWEADVHAMRYGKGKTVRGRQLKKSACVVDCLVSTN
jgi:hypothetical protein